MPPQVQRAVLFDNGMGAPQEYWDWVCRALPADMGYVRFNRPGYGLSTPDTRYGAESHFELLQELRDTYIADLPVVLAGHSLGGYFVAAYAARHPDAVKGVTQVVMIDATEVISLRHARRTDVDRWSHQRMVMEQVFAATGLSVFRPAMNVNQQYRPDINRSYKAFLATPRTWATAHREYRDAMTYPELTELDCPLTVITAENNIGDNTLHAGIQARLAVISERARHHFVVGSDHESLLSARKHAEEVTELIAGEPPREPLGPSWRPSVKVTRAAQREEEPA
ncbi:alpha/beta fold hydrolase [Streptomyces coeruleorubidus]|uniref:alpha/beta fold hydrolase n=1 Tax=Streptomyces coeruleorubidus TaxID=116188 RepID=UPI00340477A8